MSFEDKNIECGDCGQEFVHSAEDQARYAERGFSSDPKRCRPCREKRKARSDRGRGGFDAPRGQGRPSGGGGGGPRPERESFEAVCAECGVTTTLPFKPKGDRPVYCRYCYRSKK